MNRRKRNSFTGFILLLTFLSPLVMKGEGDMMLTQHWAMPTLLNPAATGDIDFIRIRGGARLQYFGSHDSPKNYLATADMPFKLMEKRIGAGLVVNSESYDLYRNLLVGAQGSYKFKIKKSTLSVGIQLGYYHTKFKGSELKLSDLGGDKPEGGDEGEGGLEPGEPEVYAVDSGDDSYDMPTQDVSAGTFDLGIGVRYEHPKFYVGISGLHLTSSTLKLTAEGESGNDTRYVESKFPATLYFDAGGNIGINNTLISLQPSLLVGTDFSYFTAVAEMRATFKQLVTFGVDYRYNRAVGVLAGLMLKNFYIGYNWEYDYKANPKGSTGNHELVIGYQFKLDMGGKNMFSHRSIRIM